MRNPYEVPLRQNYSSLHHQCLVQKEPELSGGDDSQSRSVVDLGGIALSAGLLAADLAGVGPETRGGVVAGLAFVRQFWQR